MNQFSMIRWLLVAGVASCVIDYPAHAAGSTIVSYNFTTNLTPTTLGAEVQSSSCNGSLLDRFYVAGDGFGSVLQAYPTSGTTSKPKSLAANCYFDITMTATTGYLLDLSALQFDVGKGGSTDPRGYFIRSSVGSFATDLFATQLPTGSQTAPALQSVDLSTRSAYQGLSKIDFRFYVWTPARDNSVDFRNLELLGNEVAAAPEPSSLVLSVVGVGIAMFGFYHHRVGETGRTKKHPQR